MEDPSQSHGQLVATLAHLRHRIAQLEASASTQRTDITGRQQAEAQSRLQSAALNAAADAIVITDRAGIIQWVNPAFSDLTGYTAAEAVGHNPRELVKSGDHHQAFYRDLRDTILSGQVWRGEIVNRRKDDSRYIEAQAITPVRDAQGEISHFIAVKRDITDRSAPRRSCGAARSCRRRPNESSARCLRPIRCRCGSTT